MSFVNEEIPSLQGDFSDDFSDEEEEDEDEEEVELTNEQLQEELEAIDDSEVEDALPVTEDEIEKLAAEEAKVFIGTLGEKRTKKKDLQINDMTETLIHEYLTAEIVSSDLTKAEEEKELKKLNTRLDKIIRDKFVANKKKKLTKKQEKAQKDWVLEQQKAHDIYLLIQSIEEEDEEEDEEDEFHLTQKEKAQEKKEIKEEEQGKMIKLLTRDAEGNLVETNVDFVADDIDIDDSAIDDFDLGLDIKNIVTGKRKRPSKIEEIKEYWEFDTDEEYEEYIRKRKRKEVHPSKTRMVEEEEEIPEDWQPLPPKGAKGIPRIDDDITLPERQEVPPGETRMVDLETIVDDTFQTSTNTRLKKLIFPELFEGDTQQFDEGYNTEISDVASELSDIETEEEPNVVVTAVESVTAAMIDAVKSVTEAVGITTPVPEIPELSLDVDDFEIDDTVIKPDIRPRVRKVKDTFDKRLNEIMEKYKDDPDERGFKIMELHATRYDVPSIMKELVFDAEASTRRLEQQQIPEVESDLEFVSDYDLKFGSQPSAFDKKLDDIMEKYKDDPDERGFKIMELHANRYDPPSIQDWYVPKIPFEAKREGKRRTEEGYGDYFFMPCGDKYTRSPKMNKACGKVPRRCRLPKNKKGVPTRCIKMI
jgi:hypothetical protein